MDPYSPRQDDSPSVMERSLRAVAGIGVGFGFYWGIKNNYRSMRRKFLGLAEPAKRSFERHFSFNRLDEQMTEFEKRLGIKDYTELLVPKSQVDVVVDTILRKDRQITEAIGRVKRQVTGIADNARVVGTDEQVVKKFYDTFLDFQDNYFKRAIGEGPLPTFITGETSKADIIRSLSYEQMLDMSDKLTRTRERVTRMDEEVKDVSRRVREFTSRLKRLFSRASAEKELTLANIAARDIEQGVRGLLMGAATDMASFADLSPMKVQANVLTGSVTKFWKVGPYSKDETSLKKMIGNKGAKTLGQTIRDAYKESILPGSPDVERARTNDFIGHVKSFLSSLEKQTVNEGGKFTKKYKDIYVAVSTGRDKQLIIRTVDRNGKSNVIPVDIHKTQAGVQYIKKDGREFTRPFQAQHDHLMEQGRILSQGGEVDAVTKRLEDLRGELVYSRSMVSDIVTSEDIDKRLGGNQKIYESGFSNFQKVMKRKSMRNGTLHLDIRVGPDNLPNQIGWVLTDAAGKTIDGYQFSIGSAPSQPPHLIGLEMGGHRVSQLVGKDDASKVVKALAQSLKDPRLKGRAADIITTGMNDKQLTALHTLLEAAQKSGGEGDASTVWAHVQGLEASIITDIPLVTGKPTKLGSRGMFDLLREYTADSPELKAVVEERLHKIGIPGLGDMGRKVFERGFSDPFQKVYLESLFPEVVYQAYKKTHTKGGRMKSFAAEVREVFENKMLPERLLPQEVQDALAVPGALARSWDRYRNKSPNSAVGGTLSLSRSNTAGWFPDDRRGRGDRMIHSHQMRPVTETRQRKLVKRLLEMGEYADAALAAKEIYNDIPSVTVVWTDAGRSNIVRKEDFLSTPRIRRPLYSQRGVEVVDRATLDVKIGDNLGVSKGGKTYLGSSGAAPVIFEAESGVVRDIVGISDTQVEVHFDKHVRLGAGIPVLGPHAGTIALTPLSELIPDLPIKYKFATALDVEKLDPGVLMSNMLTQMFEHAGYDKNRQQLLKDALTRVLQPKTGATADKVLRNRAGKLTVRGGNINFWRELWAHIDPGDLIEMAENYNMTVGGAFTASNYVINAGRKPGPKPLTITDGTMMLYGRILESGGIEGNVRIAQQNLRRMTNADPVKSTTDVDAGLLIRKAKELLSGKTSADNIFEAYRITRPDIVQKLEQMGLPLTRENFFSQIAAVQVGLMDKSGTLGVGMLSSDVNPKNLDVIAQVGKVKEGELGPRLFNLITSMRGSQKLSDAWAMKLYQQNSSAFAKEFGLPIATGELRAKFLRHLDAGPAARYFRKFLNQPNTVKMASENFYAAEKLYEYDGGYMTESEAKLKGFGGKFREAIRQGDAKLVTDYNPLRHRWVHAGDLGTIVRMNDFVLNFGQESHIQVPGTENTAKVNQLFVSLSDAEDVIRLARKGKSGNIEPGFLVSPRLFAVGQLIKKLNSGALDGEGNNLVRDILFTHGGNRAVKQGLRMRAQTTDVIAMNLKGYDVAGIDLDTITTKEKAMEVISGTLGLSSVNKSSFLSVKAKLLDTSLINAGNKEWEMIMGGMSPDAWKWVAKRMVGSVRAGERKVSPKTFMLHLLAGKLKGVSPQGGVNERAANAFGCLEAALNQKEMSAALEKRLRMYASEGFYELPLFMLKYPELEAMKLSGVATRTNIKGQIPWGTSTGHIGVQPSKANISGSSMDFDGDILRMLMDRDLDTVGLTEANAMLSEFKDEELQMVETSNGQVIYFNPKTGSFRKEPIALNFGKRFDKAATIQSEIISKQYAGPAATVGDNTIAYMRRLVSGRGRGIANDLGQGDPSKTITQTYEAMATFGEMVLKGKSANAGGDAVKEAIWRMGDDATFRKFADDMNEKLPTTKKLLRKIHGTEHIWPHSGGLSGLEIIREMAKSGSSPDDIFKSMVPEMRVHGMNLPSSKIYGMRGALVHAMNNYFLTQGIPTTYNEVTREGVMKSLKRNIQNDIGDANWRRVSKGMGWLAGAGAVALAANFFNRDGMGWLGHRPGTGTEQFDWSFTRPEYKMAGLLDEPFVNPYGKDRAYVVMDNPNLLGKFQRLNRAEQRDMMLVHEAVRTSTVRDVVSGPGVSNVDAGGLLSRFGHT